MIKNFLLNRWTIGILSAATGAVVMHVVDRKVVFAKELALYEKFLESPAGKKAAAAADEK